MNLYQVINKLFSPSGAARVLFVKNGIGTAGILSFLLGSGFGAGLLLALYSDRVYDFGLYLFLLSFFHFTEWFSVALYNPHNLSGDSFLINHSTAYSYAIFASLLEYFVELYFLDFKCIWPIVWFGFLVSSGGLAIRIAAKITAQHNFTHQVAYEKTEKHVLVNHGIYQHIRHPGYLGWFWWAVGTQILLCNPICIAGFFYASYDFFRDRIEIEEKLLIDFFGQEYMEYKQKTPTYIPFIA